MKRKHTVCNLVKLAIPNVNELCVKTYFCDCDNDFTTLSKLHSLTIHITNGCKRRDINSFLNRLSSLRSLTKLDFEWDSLFVICTAYS